MDIFHACGEGKSGTRKVHGAGETDRFPASGTRGNAGNFAVRRRLEALRPLDAPCFASVQAPRQDMPGGLRVVDRVGAGVELEIPDFKARDDLVAPTPRPWVITEG
jgi:hypothetical protein